MSAIERPSSSTDGGGRGIFRAAGVVAFFTVISRVLGLVRDMLIAGFFGAGLATDAFFVAFKVPNLMRRLVAEGSLSGAFVPIFAEELSVSKEAAQRTLAAVISFCLLLTGLLLAAGVIFAPALTFLFAPGFAADPGKLALAAALMRLMFPYIVFVSLLALFAAALNALNRFAVPASAPAIMNLVIIGALLLFADRLPQPVYILAFAVLFGGILVLLPQIVLLKRLGFTLLPSLPWRSPSLRRILALLLPAIFSASLYQIMVFINTLLASLLEEGSVSWLYYADRLFQFPIGVFTLALSTAALPALAHAAAAKDRDELFGVRLTGVLNWVIYVTVPASAGLCLLSQPIVDVIYVHGSFTGFHGAKTALALSAFSAGLFPLSCQNLLSRSFLAKKDAAVPLLVSTAAIGTNLLLAFAFMGTPVSSPDSAFVHTLIALQERLEVAGLGHTGLALAGSGSSWVAFLLLFAVACRRKMLSFRPLIQSFAKAAAGTVFMVGAIELLELAHPPAFFLVFFGIPVGLVSYFTATLALKSGEARLTAKELLAFARGRQHILIARD